MAARKAARRTTSRTPKAAQVKRGAVSKANRGGARSKKREIEQDDYDRAKQFNNCEVDAAMLRKQLESDPKRLKTELEALEGMQVVGVAGFDYYDPRTCKVDGGGPDKIAMWMLDTDYNGRSVYPKQVFFPMAGKDEGWAKLAKSLNAGLDEDLIEACRGTVSLPFQPSPNQTIAVKIIDDRGIENLRVMEVAT